jgi:hypothetical protein
LIGRTRPPEKGPYDEARPRGALQGVGRGEAERGRRAGPCGRKGDLFKGFGGWRYPPKGLNPLLPLL